MSKTLEDQKNIERLKSAIYILEAQRGNLISYIVEGLTGTFDINQLNADMPNSDVHLHIDHLVSLLQLADEIERQIRMRQDVLKDF